MSNQKLSTESRQHQSSSDVGAAWVSKTDIIRYRRCSYAFWLDYVGEVSLDEPQGDLQEDLISQGDEFELEVRSGVVSVKAEKKRLPELFQGTTTIVDLPVLENEHLRLYGVPDGIEPEHGLLVPVEVKLHRKPRPTDRLELAFYWLLLEPYRTRRSPQPRGDLLVPGPENGAKRVAVKLEEFHFERVRRLVDDVRAARRDGIEPKVCNCEVCIDRPEVIERADRLDGVTLIWGVGGETANLLANIGISSLKDIASCEPRAIVTHLRRNRHIVDEPKIEGWKQHARSYLTGEPVFFGTEPLPLSASFIAVDFEYISSEPGMIYLLGAAVVDGAAVILRQWWGAELPEIASNLKDLDQLLQQHPTLPIVTWHGSGAEVSELKRAREQQQVLAESLKLPDKRHLDLFAYVRRSVRFPISRLGLKDVGDYFGFKRASAIEHGMMATSYYFRFCRATDHSEKNGLRDALMEYNREDLGALVEVTRRLQVLSGDALLQRPTTL